MQKKTELQQKAKLAAKATEVSGLVVENLVLDVADIFKLSPAKFDAIIAEKIRKLSVVSEKNSQFQKKGKIF